MTNDYSVLYFSENGVDVVDNSNIAIIYSTHFNTPEACKVQQDDVTKMYLKAGAADPVALCDYESSFGGWSFFNVYQEAGFVLPSGQITLVDVPKTYSSFQACIADKARVVAFYSNNMAFTADFAFCSHTNQLIDASVLQLIAVH